MLFLGGVFALSGVVFWVFPGYFSGGVGKWLAKPKHLADKIRWLTGGVLIAPGLRLAFLERK